MSGLRAQEHLEKESFSVYFGGYGMGFIIRMRTHAMHIVMEMPAIEM